jgi:3-oxoacyl-[acyl-carrier protein] reductase
MAMGRVSLSLQGKKAIVTGGKSGIGKAIALAFAGEGADVAVCDRSVEDGQLEATAEEIRRLGHRSMAVKADVGHKAEVSVMFERVKSEFGEIDILVNNAGMTIRSMLIDATEQDWDAVMETDLKGVFLCSQAASKIMIERRKGNIINIATRSVNKAESRRGIYITAKAGVIMLTRCLAQELGTYGIRANAIAPGLVRTQFSHHSDEDLKMRVAKIPLGRIAEPEDVAGAAVFLASDASAYITGTTIFVDGGQSA